MTFVTSAESSLGRCDDHSIGLIQQTGFMPSISDKEISGREDLCLGPSHGGAKQVTRVTYQ